MYSTFILYQSFHFTTAAVVVSIQLCIHCLSPYGLIASHITFVHLFNGHAPTNNILVTYGALQVLYCIVLYCIVRVSTLTQFLLLDTFTIVKATDHCLWQNRAILWRIHKIWTLLFKISEGVSLSSFCYQTPNLYALDRLVHSRRQT